MIRRLANENDEVMQPSTYIDTNSGVLRTAKVEQPVKVIDIPIENAIPQQAEIIEETPIQVKEEPVILPDITQQAITNEEILSNDKTLLALANSLKDIEPIEIKIRQDLIKEIIPEVAEKDLLSQEVRDILQVELLNSVDKIQEKNPELSKAQITSLGNNDVIQLKQIANEIEKNPDLTVQEIAEVVNNVTNDKILTAIENVKPKKKLSLLDQLVEYIYNLTT